MQVWLWSLQWLRALVRFAVIFPPENTATGATMAAEMVRRLPRRWGYPESLRPVFWISPPGLGADGFVLATLGCNVTLLERNPIVHSLLADGIERGTAAGLYDSELGLIMARLSLLQASSSDYLQVLVDRLTNCSDDSESASVQPDVVYIDPMFPLRKKSAKVKKEMQAFHQIVGTDNDSDALLNNALTVAQYRVVVKRPAGAGFLAEAKPSYSLKGKSTRYDIYTLKKLPG